MKGLIVCCTFSAVAVAGLARADTSGWHELARHTLGGNGGWDLMSVDAPARRIYVTRGEYVMVVDADDGRLVGQISSLKRAHGVALAPAQHRGFITSGGDDAVVVFDLDSREVVGKIAVDHNPDAIVYDAKSRQVVVFNAGSNTASVIDPDRNARIATIVLPGKPELAVDDDDGILVNLEDVAKVARLDIRSARVSSVWALPQCEDPSGIAADAAHARIFSVCQNRLMIVTDSHTGRHVASVAIGTGPDGAAFDPASGNAFSSNSDGTLTVIKEIDPDHFSVAQTIATPERSRCVTFDLKTHRAILAAATFGAVPTPTVAEPHPRPPMQPDSFGLVIVGR